MTTLMGGSFRVHLGVKNEFNFVLFTHSKCVACTTSAQQDEEHEEEAQRSAENGYEWFTSDDGTNFYRTVGSGVEWVKFENLVRVQSKPSPNRAALPL